MIIRLLLPPKAPYIVHTNQHTIVLCLCPLVAKVAITLTTNVILLQKCLPLLQIHKFHIYLIFSLSKNHIVFGFIFSEPGF